MVEIPENKKNLKEIKCTMRVQLKGATHIVSRLVRFLHKVAIQRPESRLNQIIHYPAHSTGINSLDS